MAREDGSSSLLDVLAIRSTLGLMYSMRWDTCLWKLLTKNVDVGHLCLFCLGFVTNELKVDFQINLTALISFIGLKFCVELLQDYFSLLLPMASYPN